MGDTLKNVPHEATPEEKRLSAEITDGEIAPDVVIVDPALQQSKRVREQVAPKESVTVPVTAEFTAPRLTQSEERKKIRVLYISNDESLFEEGSSAQKRAARNGELFEELHIVVCTMRTFAFDVLKVSEHVFVYPTQSPHRLWYLTDVFAVVKHELFFANAFRVDVVCCADTFEIGCIAYLVARYYKRGLYVEILNNIFDPYYQATIAHPKIRFLFAGFLIPRADWIRVRESELRDALRAHYPRIAEKISVVPEFADISSLRTLTPTSNLHLRYQAKYVMLMYARLVPESNILLAIEACQVVLRQYETIRLVIVGVGPEDKKIRARIAEKGLEKSIFIDHGEWNRFEYFKTADMFLSTSTKGIERELLVEIMSLGLPILASRAGAAAEYIENERTGLLCAPGDLTCMMRGVNTYLNNVSLRERCGRNAKEQMSTAIKVGESNHQHLYQESVERTIVSYVEKMQSSASGSDSGV